MIVLDASVLISHVEPSDGHHAEARRLLLSWSGDQLGISPVSLTEFYVGPARAGVLDRAEDVVRRLGVHVIDLPQEAARSLAVLRAQTRLKLPDCFVLLAAEQAGASVATFDLALRRAAVGRKLQVAT